MRIILFFLFSVSLFLTQSAGAFEMSDSRLDMITGKTQTFNVSNPDDIAITVRVEIEADHIKPVPVGVEDCSTFLRAFPRTFKVEPKSAQTIKFISRQAGHCRVFFEVDKDMPEQIALNDAVINTRYKIGIPANVK